MFGEAFQLYAKHWKETTIVMVIVTVLAFILAYASIYFLGAAGVVPAYISFLLLLDTGRTFLLIKYSGEKPSIWRVAKRICVDSLFWALFIVMAFVAPGIAYVGAATGKPEISALASILGYYFLFLLLFFYVELFEAGYRAAVKDEGIAESIINAEKSFKKDKVSTVKKVTAYSVPFLLYITGNALVRIVPTTWQQTVAQIVFIITVLFLLPYAEALYVTLLRKR